MSAAGQLGKPLERSNARTLNRRPFPAFFFSPQRERERERKIEKRLFLVFQRGKKEKNEGRMTAGRKNQEKEEENSVSFDWCCCCCCNISSLNIKLVILSCYLLFWYYKSKQRASPHMLIALIAKQSKPFADWVVIYDVMCSRVSLYLTCFVPCSTVLFLPSC